jgi:hypothetical protein
MKVKRLQKKIIDVKVTDVPKYGRSPSGYTYSNGAPTRYKVKLEGEHLFRRLQCWQFTNVATYFLRISGVEYIVPEAELDAVQASG